MLKKYKLLAENGISEMICSKIGEYILVYGGSNFPYGTPPEGKKKLYNKMYLFDKSFNLLYEKEGKLKPCGAIVVADGSKLWYIIENTIYLIELDGEEIKESEFLHLDFMLECSFACKFENELIFGGKSVYKLSLKDKTLTNLKEFPADFRRQCIYQIYGKYLYVFGGASNICYMDSYKYDLLEDKWQRLDDIPVSFTGAAYTKYDEAKLLIMGGFDKEVYDEAVKNLSDINYKKAYFKRSREEFRWNKNYYIYDFKNEKFSKLEEDANSATCGAGLIKDDDIFYLVCGEVKPGLRSPYIYSINFKSLCKHKQMNS